MSNTPPRRTVSTPTNNNNNNNNGHALPPLPLERANSAPVRGALDNDFLSIRHHVQFRDRRFNVGLLPADLQRVYHQLHEEHDEEYALVFVFIVRTAVELHRAWHMTLLTSKILHMIKKRHDVRCTWNLGVVKLIFRVDDGRLELHRKVPYDYDSEFQDLYYKIAKALCEDHINIHEALCFQQEVKQGLHTAPSGKFLRDTPGRLLLYPLEAATCAVIFFGGDGMDALVAAICGLAAGSMEWALTVMGDRLAGEVKILIDVLAGISTGVIGGLFYRFYDGEEFCLAAIFLGTLYWFFYGTAFVLGLLEIVAGELETGVTRFIAVSVKTFVLTMGASIGLMIAVDENVFDAWNHQFQPGNKACNQINLDEQWWRIPLYLLCSASALGQYRFPVYHYWRGLIVQLVGYEVQYQMFKYFEGDHQQDFLDTAASNIAGAAAAVVAASILRFLVDECGEYYSARLLDRTVPDSWISSCLYHFNVGFRKLTHALRIGRVAHFKQLKLEDILQKNKAELHDPNHPRTEIKLTEEEEKCLLDAIVDSHGLNLWALLMPAVYQLVPGSMIAKLWFNAIFPPPLIERTFSTEDGAFTDLHVDPKADEVFFGLWVVSLSLALGLVIGNAITALFTLIFDTLRDIIRPRKNETAEQKAERMKRQSWNQHGVMTGAADKDDDPDGGGMTDKKTDEPIAVSSWRDAALPSTNSPARVACAKPKASSVRLSPMHQGVFMEAVKEDREDGDGEVQNGATVPTVVK